MSLIYSASRFPELLIENLNEAERIRGMRKTLCSVPQDFLTSRHALWGDLKNAPGQACSMGAWITFISALKGDKLKQVFNAMMVEATKCFDGAKEFLHHEWPRSVKKLEAILPGMWSTFMDILPSYDPKASEVPPLGPDLSALGTQDESEPEAGSISETVVVESEARVVELRALIESRKRSLAQENLLRDGVLAKRAKLARDEESRLRLELASLTEADNSQAVSIRTGQREAAQAQELANLRQELSALKSRVASTGGSVFTSVLPAAGFSNSASSGGDLSVHPWSKYSGLAVVRASADASLSAHLESAAPHVSRKKGEEAGIMDILKPSSYPVGFIREIHGVCQRPIQKSVLKSMAAGDYGEKSTPLGCFLPNGNLARDKVLRDMAARPAATVILQALFQNESFDSGSIQARSSASSSLLQPANLFDFITAVESFGKMLRLLRPSEESASFMVFFTVFKQFVSAYPTLSVARFMGFWNFYVQTSMQEIFEVQFEGAPANCYNWESESRIAVLRLRAEMAVVETAAALSHQASRVRQETAERDRNRRAAQQANRFAQQARPGGDVSGGRGNGSRGSGRGGGGGRGGRGAGGNLDQRGLLEVDEGADGTEQSGSVSAVTVFNPPSKRIAGSCNYGERCYKKNNGCPYSH